MGRRPVVHFLETSEFGGQEQMVLTTLAVLDRAEWDPVLAYHPAPGLAPMTRVARELDVGLRPLPRPPSRLAAGAVLQFARLLKEYRAAIFHAHLNGPLSCKYALLGAGVARVPGVVATAHLFTDMPKRVTIRVQQRLVATQVDCYIAVSHDVSRRIRATLHVPASRLRVVHNSLPITYATRSSAEMAAVPSVHGRPVVLTAARLEDQKGIEYLLEAAALVPDAVFVIAGDGSRRTRLESRRNALGLHDRVEFLGYRDDVPDLVACCDLFALPSLEEGLPLAVLEAMAAGKPVIATGIGGTDEAVIDGQTGLLVPPRDPAALAGAINTLLADRAGARALGAAAQHRVRTKFSRERMGRQVAEIYHELLASPPVHG